MNDSPPAPAATPYDHDGILRFPIGRGADAPEGSARPDVLKEFGRAMERAYVGHRMAALWWLTMRLKCRENTHSLYLRHDGGARAFASAAPAFGVPFRGQERLDRIAARILLGRARLRAKTHHFDHRAREAAGEAARELRLLAQPT